jgi:hypothetical protein
MENNIKEVVISICKLIEDFLSLFLHRIINSLHIKLDTENI